MEHYLFYDEEIDHLTIQKADEKIESNIDTGLAILSFNKEKQLVGIELMGVKKNFKISEDALQAIESCAIEYKYNPSTKILVVQVQLRYAHKESPIVCAYENFDLGTIAFQNAFACSAA